MDPVNKGNRSQVSSTKEPGHKGPLHMAHKRNGHEIHTVRKSQRESRADPQFDIEVSDQGNRHMKIETR